MLRVNQVKIRTGHSEEALKKKIAEILRVPGKEISGWKIIRQSIDARKKPVLFYSYTLDVDVKNEERILHKFQGKEQLVCKAQRAVYHFPEPGKTVREFPIVIVGMGPAGLFCAYFLALHGYRPILLERGKSVEERQRDVEVFWKTGKLNPNSNVQFGEGGAGAFSDGKLNTLVKDKYGRNAAVLETLVKFGADERILYDAKPHIGTDVLLHVVRRMREEIIRLGGQVRFESQVTDILMEQGRVTGVVIEGGEKIDCRQLVLALGHSARDTFSMLYDRQVPMEAKAFAVGLRVEHPQSMINESQYGIAEPGDLGSAPYKVTARAKNGRGVYSFCMCPGGYVVNASSEEGRTAVNGMSYSARDGKNANSAIIVTVTPEDFGSSHPLAGISFQRKLEERAFSLGGGRIPVQRYGDFKRCVEQNAGNQEQQWTEQFSELTPQCRGAYQWADVSRILPKECNEAIVDGMETFARQIKDFNRPDVCMSGVESRTSSPVRIVRDDNMQSQISGLYPCGEGAGYAGGIVSAAIDGIRVAEAIGRTYRTWEPAGKADEIKKENGQATKRESRQEIRRETKQESEREPRQECEQDVKPETKRKVRRAILNIRDSLSEEERNKASLLLTERILGHQWFYRAESFLCFVSYGSEISTRDLLREALRAGKKVYVPKVLQDMETPRMRFYRIGTLEELSEGFHGIPEPSGNSEEYIYSEDTAKRSLLLMPGVAFDKCRDRLGYGMGFYDRYLADKEELRLRTIGVGYACQLVEKLPASPTDIKPCQVICV